MQLLEDHVKRRQSRREQKHAQPRERCPQRQCGCRDGENSRKDPRRISGGPQGAAHDVHTEDTPVAVLGDGYEAVRSVLDNARTVEDSSEPFDDREYWREHPNPSDQEVDEVCDTWLKYQSQTRDLEGVDDQHPDWWAVMTVEELDGEPLQFRWRVIRRLCERAEGGDEHAIGMIGCGPVETLLFEKGEEAMDLIEPTADEVPALLAALESVWGWDDPYRPRLDRYLAAKGRGRS